MTVCVKIWWNYTKPFIQLKSQNIFARFSFRKDVLFDTFGIVDINIVREEAEVTILLRNLGHG